MRGEFGNGHRAQVAVQAQSLADTKQAFLRVDVRGNIIPFWSADSTEQHSVSSLSAGDGCFRQGNAGCVDCAAADELLVIFNFKAVFFGSSVENLYSCINYFYTNAVTGQ